VYAYGLTLWELLHHCDPDTPLFPGFSHEALYNGKHLRRGMRPSTVGMHPDLASLMEDCWAKQPDDRQPAEQFSIAAASRLGHSKWAIRKSFGSGAHLV
jgi:hypothetical protein